MKEQKNKTLFKNALGAFNRARPSVSLRLTPMIDVVFLLLIFFLVTSKFNLPEKHIKIDSPKQQADINQADTDKPTVAISLTQKSNGFTITIGSMEIYLKQSTMDNDLKTLKAKLETIDSKRPVEITSGDDLAWDYLAKTCSLLETTGFENITFVTQQEQ